MAVKFPLHVDVYDSRPWFQIPKSIAKLLGLRSGHGIAVTISKAEGEPLYHGLAKLGSGTEIYQAHISKRLKKGEKIRVTASRPPERTVKQ